ncbi:hypothetical protein C1X69_14420 [Pseudomonas sp. FW305-67]|nr:hypothetical protein C1X70_12865 [Pseudomonas sp. FW305-53]PMY87020.1 hypothetical protein C1X68_11585 [Pseudomonas sp. FW303-C2]PMY92656.1 hypothetical protein C1X67_12530 [Pseudomonas sp. FW305-62]PNA45839.1 hypothetical protein C1X71_03900 [Pseudomonas sp. FW306-2-2C-A10BC]PNA88659.1 hypothetical protein C1X66_04455 [Pseudomonas sp. MPR-R3B]PNB20539.1 hypothetical protein C1X69_14420 [Pseudomonas sp. FW305-67]
MLFLLQGASAQRWGGGAYKGTPQWTLRVRPRNLKGISDCDLTRVTRAVHLLTREGCAVLDVIQARVLQREEGGVQGRCLAV